MRPDDLARRIQAWAQVHPGVFVVERQPNGLRLAEVATGKALVVLAEPVQAVEVRSNTATGAEYLVLQRDGLPPLGLADAGFVFALDPRSTGPLPPSAPPVLSFRDFERLHAHLIHVAPEPAHRREALELLMILVAALDGARNAGLDTGREEAALEHVLRDLEGGA
jgi:hypothetical protein